jgi:DNA-binding GntR family transcriptional regulator
MGASPDRSGESLIKTEGGRGVGIQHLLRADIVSGALPLGARLQIDALALRYRVSHTPVREALRELRGEGLVEMEPNRGARVRAINADFVENIFDVRAAIETMMTARAAERRPPEALVALEAAAAEFETAVAASDSAAIFTANRALHDIVYQAGGNPEAFAFFKRHWMLVAALFDRHGHDAERMRGEIIEHRYLIHAIERRDSAGAAMVIATQIRNAKLDLLRRMRAT